VYAQASDYTIHMSLPLMIEGKHLASACRTLSFLALQRTGR
jgi:hypothetical protein